MSTVTNLYRLSAVIAVLVLPAGACQPVMPPTPVIDSMPESTPAPERLILQLPQPGGAIWTRDGFTFITFTNEDTPLAITLTVVGVALVARSRRKAA